VRTLTSDNGLILLGICCVLPFFGGIFGDEILFWGHFTVKMPPKTLDFERHYNTALDNRQ